MLKLFTAKFKPFLWTDKCRGTDLLLLIDGIRKLGLVNTVPLQISNEPAKVSLCLPSLLKIQFAPFLIIPFVAAILNNLFVPFNILNPNRLNR